MRTEISQRNLCTELADVPLPDAAINSLMTILGNSFVLEFQFESDLSVVIE